MYWSWPYVAFVFIASFFAGQILTKMQLCGLKERAFSFLKVFDSLWGYANTVDERANNRKVYTIWSWGWHLHFRHSSKNFLWLTSNGLPIRLQPIMSQTVWPICRIVTVSLLVLFWLIVILIPNSHFSDTQSGLSSLGVPGVPWHLQFLADQLTLSQPRGADYAYQIIQKLLAPPNFQTFRRPCLY